MKIDIFLKDPDGFYESLSSNVGQAVREEFEGSSMDEDEIEDLVDERIEKVNQILKKWVEYGECVTLVLNTDANTLTVKPLSR